MTVERFEIKSSEASSEDWGAHTHTRVFRTSDQSTVTAKGIRDLICAGTGYGGIIAETGGPLTIDSTVEGEGCFLGCVVCTKVFYCAINFDLCHEPHPTLDHSSGVVRSKSSFLFWIIYQFIVILIIDW